MKVLKKNVTQILLSFIGIAHLIAPVVFQFDSIKGTKMHFMIFLTRPKRKKNKP